MVMSNFADSFDAAVDAVLSAACAMPTDPAAVGTLADCELLRGQRKLGEIRRAIDACAALIAGEVGHRSRPDLGYGGLAQREGFRTPEALVQHQTQSTNREASTLVQVGAIVREAMIPAAVLAADRTPIREPWLADVGAAVSAGTLSIEAARAIRTGLGVPTSDAAGPGISVGDLSRAATLLLREATSLNADQLHRRARELRDDLDEAGIADRERAIHEQRSVRLTTQPNGLPRITIVPDIESGAFWKDVVDTLTSPRRGGPRFVNESDKTWADSIANDVRSTEQYLHDALTELLRLTVGAGTVQTRAIVGSRQPSVRVLVTADTLDSRTGHGRIEGCDLPISPESVERIACESGIQLITFSPDGRPLDVGREQRLYNSRQRKALAARDGGCMWGDCDRPPGWCEAHHILHWARDGGKTNSDDGILLCRYHHLLLHNNHWEIVRTGVDYWLIPPADVDPTQIPRLMPSKSAALRDLLRQNAARESA